MLKSSFLMEFEQRVLIKYLRFKGLKLSDIYDKLVFTFDDEVYTFASAEH
jgi:hypothetical protein